MRVGRYLSYGALGFGLTGLAGLYVSRETDSESLLLFSLVFILMGAAYVSLDTIVTRQESVSHGEYGPLGYLVGLQAVLSGLSTLLLVLAVLIPLLLWIMGWGGWVKDVIRTHPGLFLLLPGLWLFLNQFARVIGRTYAGIAGTATDGKLERGVSFVNALLEKSICAILSVVGLLLMLWGLVSLLSGRGPLDVLFSVL